MKWKFYLCFRKTLQGIFQIQKLKKPILPENAIDIIAFS